MKQTLRAALLLTLVFTLPQTAWSGGKEKGTSRVRGGGRMTKVDGKWRLTDLVPPKSHCKKTVKLWDLIQENPQAKKIVDNVERVHWYLGKIMEKEAEKIDVCFTNKKIKWLAIDQKDAPFATEYCAGEFKKPKNCEMAAFRVGHKVYANNQAIKKLYKEDLGVLWIHELTHSYLAAPNRSTSYDYYQRHTDFVVGLMGIRRDSEVVRHKLAELIIQNHVQVPPRVDSKIWTDIMTPYSHFSDSYRPDAEKLSELEQIGIDMVKMNFWSGDVEEATQLIARTQASLYEDLFCQKRPDKFNVEPYLIRLSGKHYNVDPSFKVLQKSDVEKIADTKGHCYDGAVEEKILANIDGLNFSGQSILDLVVAKLPNVATSTLESLLIKVEAENTAPSETTDKILELILDGSVDSAYLRTFLSLGGDIQHLINDQVEASFLGEAFFKLTPDVMRKFIDEVVKQEDSYAAKVIKAIKAANLSSETRYTIDRFNEAIRDSVFLKAYLEEKPLLFAAWATLFQPNADLHLPEEFWPEDADKDDYAGRTLMMDMVRQTDSKRLAMLRTLQEKINLEPLLQVRDKKGRNFVDHIYETRLIESANITLVDLDPTDIIQRSQNRSYRFKVWLLNRYVEMNSLSEVSNLLDHMIEYDSGLLKVHESDLMYAEMLASRRGFTDIADELNRVIQNKKAERFEAKPKRRRKQIKRRRKQINRKNKD